MLTTSLLHPQLLESLASLGHGSRVLIADGNYPFRTAIGARAQVVYLNLAPGMFSVDQVLNVLKQSVPFESVVMMDAPVDVPVQSQILGILDEDIAVQRVGRSDFYDLARGVDTGLLIATGEQRVYANVLLTIGVV